MDDELDFSDYMHMLKRHWFLSLITFIIVFGAILAYTFFTASTYQAKSLITLNSQDQANFLLGSSAPKVTDIQTQMIVIQSSNVMYPVYSRHDANTFTFSVNDLTNSNIISISVDSNSPEKSAIIANDIAATYIDYTTQMRNQDAEDNVNLITDMLKQYDTDINALNVKAANYKSQGNTISKNDLIDYQNVQRELTAKNDIYNRLLTKREQAMLTTSLNSTNVNIIEYATAPSTPIKPNKKLNIVLGLIIAFGAAFGMAMIANSAHEKKPKRF